MARAIEMRDPEMAGEEGHIATLERGMRSLRAQMERLSAAGTAALAGGLGARGHSDAGALAATLRSEIAGLRDGDGSGFAQKTLDLYEISPALLRRALAADAARRRSAEEQLLQLVSASAELRHAVLAERAAREEGERRLLRYTADLATLLGAELAADRRAREERERLCARIDARLAGSQLWRENAAERRRRYQPDLIPSTSRAARI